MHVVKVPVKPLSVNQCFQGKRFKTKAYKQYEKEILLNLKPMNVEGGKLSLFLRFGLSSKNADIDNPVKPFVDCLQKRYGFNDRHIYRLEVEKVDVKKGKEFIEFELKPMIEQK